MAYIYLLDLYETIDQRIEKIKLCIENSPENSNEVKYLEGRIQALIEFKKILIDNLNIKLPRKIRKQFKKL
jgi:hypothetical protein